eukprot:TRINITY_DN5746_c1_g1_i1.p1 TRINITY_DN5746_c1_g1~~TRINITY_DN5746_c1_g1_i1.p1  ORF type:complete len:311 (-),score=64.13 TRINITY_DN5746_c1_g1_i1:82-1014(-)
MLSHGVELCQEQSKNEDRSRSPREIDEKDRVFAFFKPRPMITDLTKGGMGEVSRKMNPRNPPKPVGQLDRCTTGLMIFTTDGRLTSHLNSHVAKSYRAWYDGWSCSDGRKKGELSDQQVKDLLAGIELSRDDGFARFESVEHGPSEDLDPVTLKTGEVMSKVRYSADVKIKCGKFHVVKRLFSSAGKSVIRLQRFSVAGLSLSGVGLSQPGDFVELNVGQIEKLWQGCSCRRGSACSSIGSSNGHGVVDDGGGVDGGGAVGDGSDVVADSSGVVDDGSDGAVGAGCARGGGTSGAVGADSASGGCVDAAD